MTLFFFSMLILYASVMLWLVVAWEQIPASEALDQGGETQFSILVPVRNESENILRLLSALRDQKYPKAAYEILIINDQSEDDTVSKVVTFQEENPSLKLRLLHLLPESGRIAHKKAALTLGVQEAKFPVILTTDGDCWMGESWLASFSAFYQAKKSKLISASVKVSGGTSLFPVLQTIEFSTLIGTGAILLSRGLPAMANGANLCFEKEAFQSVRGYSGNTHIPSGDDEFLVRKVLKAFPTEVHFLKSKAAVVATNPQSSLASFFHQRLRWASKWNAHRDWQTPVLAFLVWLFHLLHLTAWGIFAVTLDFWLFAVLITKVFTEFLLIRRWLSFLGEKKSIRFIPVTQIAYSFYVVFFGIAAQRKKYRWKGRTF
ncbi:MAG: glycosyltransferase [Bacteroidota bacterium]